MPKADEVSKKAAGEGRLGPPTEAEGTRAAAGEHQEGAGKTIDGEVPGEASSLFLFFWIWSAVFGVEVMFMFVALGTSPQRRHGLYGGFQVLAGLGVLGQMRQHSLG